MKSKFKIEVAMTGPDASEVLRGLTRIITWTTEGVIYESDHRHADRLVEELGLKKGQVVVTP